jgi:hypothetical protein
MYYLHLQDQGISQASNQKEGRKCPVQVNPINRRWSSPAQSFLVSGPMAIFFFTDFYAFGNGASSSEREGVWLLLFIRSLLGSDSAGTHSLFSLSDSHRCENFKSSNESAPYRHGNFSYTSTKRVRLRGK